MTLCELQATLQDSALTVVQFEGVDAERNYTYRPHFRQGQSSSSVFQELALDHTRSISNNSSFFLFEEFSC